MLVKDQARQDQFIITACNFLMMTFSKVIWPTMSLSKM